MLYHSSHRSPTKPKGPQVPRDGWHGIERPPHKHLQHARLGKHKAPRAVAGYKRSSVALLLLRLPGRDTQARSGTGLAKTIRWVLYGGEANRVAKKKEAQPQG